MKNDKKLNTLLNSIIQSQIKDPKNTPDNLIVIPLKDFKNIMKPSRIEVIRTIKKRKPNSVVELSKFLNRPQDSVSRDLKLLENYSMLEFLVHEKMKKPIVNKEVILVPI